MPTNIDALTNLLRLTFYVQHTLVMVRRFLGNPPFLNAAYATSRIIAPEFTSYMVFVYAYKLTARRTKRAVDALGPTEPSYAVYAWNQLLKLYPDYALSVLACWAYGESRPRAQLLSLVFSSQWLYLGLDTRAGFDLESPGHTLLWNAPAWFLDTVIPLSLAEPLLIFVLVWFHRQGNCFIFLINAGVVWTVGAILYALPLHPLALERLSLFQAPNFVLGVICGIHVNERATEGKILARPHHARNSALMLFGLFGIYTLVKYYQCEAALRLTPDSFAGCARSIPLLDSTLNKSVLLGMPLFLYVADLDHRTFECRLPRWTLLGHRFGLQSFLWHWPVVNALTAAAIQWLPKTEWIFLAEASMAAPYAAGLAAERAWALAGRRPRQNVSKQFVIVEDDVQPSAPLMPYVYEHDDAQPIESGVI